MPQLAARYGLKPADLDEMTHNEIVVFLDDLERSLKHEAKNQPARRG